MEKIDKVAALKIEIFDLIRQQEKLQMEMNNIQRVKIEKARALEKLEQEENKK